MTLYFLDKKEKSITFVPEIKKQHRGVEQLVARQAHNLEVVRSSRASATKKSETNPSLRLFYFSILVSTSGK